MLEQYALMLDQHCQREIAAEIRTIDLGDADESDRLHEIYQTFLKTKAVDCLQAYAGFVGWSMKDGAPREVVGRFMTIANSVSSENKDALRPAVERVFQLIEYPTVSFGLYFKTAGLFDVRFDESLHDWFKDASFTKHTDEAYAYAEYLVLIGHPGGVARFDAALTATEGDVHTMNGVLSGMSSLAGRMHHAGRDLKPMLNVMRRYLHDQRRGIGVDGPGSGPNPGEIVGPVIDIFGG